MLDKKNKSFLFIFRMKISQARYVYNTLGYKEGSLEYLDEYQKNKIVQSGWIKSVNNKILLYRISYLFFPLSFFMGYLRWLRVVEILRKSRLLVFFDKLLFNFIIFLICLFKKINYIVYYDHDIFSLTVSLCGLLKVTVIEYDGRSPLVGKRDYSNDIEFKFKYLVSNMDIKSKIGRNKSNFRQIILGVDNDLSHDIFLNEKDLDLSFIGNMDDEVFSQRCFVINSLLGLKNPKFSMELYGYKKNIEKYNNIKHAIIRDVYGSDYVSVMKRSKLSVVVPSDDHLGIGNGMPMRFFENSAFGVVQLVYRTTALKNTDFIDGEHFVFFDDIDDLIDKIDFYLKNEKARVAIAEKAQNLFKQKYTAQKSFLKLIESIK